MEISINTSIFIILTVSLSDLLILEVLSQNCLGPFSIEPTENKCPYVDCDVLKSCIRQCADDACCRAGGVQEGSCVISYTNNNTLHFNKIIPESVGECLGTGEIIN